MTDSYISSDGVSLHVEDADGGSDALVFLRYWGGSTRTWDAVADRMTARCVAIDHRGWGRSSAPETGYTTADLARIDVPVLVVAGQCDRVEPVELMRSHVTDLIPGARLDVIPDAGHLLPLERPDALAERIETFWKDLPTWH